MISFSPNEFFGTIILLPFAAIFLLLALVVVKKIVGIILKIVQNHREFKVRMKQVEAMKASGEQHEWISMAISTTEEAHVCVKTGWCPKTYGFYNISYVQNLKKERLRAESYDKFRKQRIEEIADELGINVWLINTLVDKIISIPKDYHVSKLDDLQQELKAVGEKNK